MSTGLCRLSSRWAAWVFAVVLLLNAAMPMLASLSAQAQGKPLGEVCSVYGVVVEPVDAQGDVRTAGGHPDGHPDAAGDAAHCLLGALAPHWAAAPVGPLGFGVATADLTPRVADHPARGAHDALAAWAARLHHGPPARG